MRRASPSSRRSRRLAQTFDKPITVHNTQPTVGTLAHLHLWVSTPSCIYPQEYNIEPHPLRDDTPIWREPVLVKNGQHAASQSDPDWASSWTRTW